MKRWWLVPLAVIGLAVGTGGVTWWVRSRPTSLGPPVPSTEVGPRVERSTDPVEGSQGSNELEPVDVPRVAVARVPVEPMVGPNGQPLPPGTTPREAGLPERGEPQHPVGDPEEWKRMRAEAARQWRADSMEVAERFARDQGLATPERDGMLGALRELHDGLEATRDAIEAGRIHPSEGRREMAAVRARAEADLVEVLGSVRTEALRDALSELPGGGF